MILQFLEKAAALKKEQVRSHNDAYELDILRHFRTFWENSDEFGAI